MATQKTTAALKKKKKLTKSGAPRKWSDAWWAEYWNYEYEMLRHSLKDLDKHLLAAEIYCINENMEKIKEAVENARGLYRRQIYRPTVDLLTVVEDTPLQSLTEFLDGLEWLDGPDRGKAESADRGKA
jgi:hypothetical protein